MKFPLLSIGCCAFIATASIQSAKAVAIVIDNGDFGSGYSVVGVTEQATGVGTTTYGDDHAFNTTPGDLNAAANYAFSGLATGTYEVFASWRQEGQNNTGLMTISISDGGPSVDVDQFHATSTGGPGNGGPLADLILNDGLQDINFQLLGTVTVSDGDLLVSASRSALSTQQFFINDAIAINLIPEPSSGLFGLIGLGLLAARRRR